jgi:RNA polymerase sigma-70 factor (sigma-E family)
VADQEFRSFVAGRQPRLQRAAFSLCGDWHTAQDLVQQTLEDAYVHWGKVQRADSPDAYLQRMLINRARSQWRRRSSGEIPTAELGDEKARPDFSQALADRQALIAALSDLPRRQRESVVLRHVGGLSEAETASVLGVSVGSVKSLTSRGLATLRHRLRAEVFA